jgi:hypothetical protein
MDTNTEFLRIANDSGFPLQIAIERAVSESTTENGWSVRYSEHAWSNQLDQQSGFIDLVLQNRYKTTFMVVECKRVRQSSWVFLQPDSRGTSRRHSKAWVSHYSAGAMMHFGWHDVPIDPTSPEATFCAVRGQSSNDRNTLLERIGGELISATESLAFEEKDFRPTIHPSIRYYFNVIVTTAELKVARFDPSKISLTDGSLAEAEIVDVPFVRFRKQLAMRNIALTPEDYKERTDVAYRKQNTVFVVRAEALSTFLDEFEIPETSSSAFQ